MDISGIISSLRLGHSIIKAQTAASEKRQQIYDSLVGRQTSLMPEIGRKIRFQVQNCAYQDDEKHCYLSVRIENPNRKSSFSRLETDFRYHYLNLYLRGAGSASELGHPLIKKLNFRELGPNEFFVDTIVDSADPPTLTLAFERVETTMSQIHTEYHQYLQSMYEKYGDEVVVKESFNESGKEYVANLDIDEKELIPQPVDENFALPRNDESLSSIERIKMSSWIRDYIEWVATAEVGGTEYLEFS